MNDTTGPDSLVLTLLVFRTYPRITTSDNLLLTITERSKAIEKAIKQVTEIYTKRQVRDALK